MGKTFFGSTDRFVLILLMLGVLTWARTSESSPLPPSLDPPKSIVLGSSQSKEREEWHTKRYALYKQTIQRELKRKSIPSWAGEWGVSAPFTWGELLVAPSGLFVKGQGSDIPLDFWQSGMIYGTAQLVAGQFILRLAPDLDDMKGRTFIPGPYLIEWNGKQCTVEPEHMLDFVNTVNAGVYSPSSCNLGFYTAPPNPDKVAPLIKQPQLPPPGTPFY